MSNTIVNIPEFTKHPSAVIDIDFRLVTDDADTITDASVYTVSPSGLTCTGTSITGATAKAWFSGGTDEADYEFTLLLGTTLGRTEVAQAIIKVRA